MPPKRKNKATKTSTTASLKTLPANPASSPKRRNSAGFPGQKMSRLHPSEPLHMKTRRAVKTASNQDSSDAPSITSSISRRSSLNDLSRSEDGHSDIEDERPTKRNRLSTDSGTDSFADQVDGALNRINAPESSMSNPRDATDGSIVSPKKRRASDGSFESSKSRANGVLTRTQSDTSEQQPRRKKRRRATQTPAETDQLPELTDASTAPNSPEQIPEVENSQNLHHVLPTNGDAPAKMGRRLPGRRRAPHADINVEVDLRRQLNLKMSYRSLAKIQKSILEELSNRTTTSLDDDPQFHKHCPEYEPLMASLQRYKNTRLGQVEALRREKLAQLERIVKAERHIAKEKYIQRFYDLQEDLLLQCFYRAKQLQRESRKCQDGAGTEDEDNILPPARFAFPPLHTDDRVGSKFASRSRAYVESEHLLDDELRRALFGGSLRHFITEDDDADDSILETPTPVGFATFTGPDRAEAIAHQNIKDLIDAANDIENTPIAPPAPAVIPNEQADALFMLASLSADVPRNTAEEKKLYSERYAPAAVDSRQATSTETAQTSSPLEQPTGPFAAVLNPVSKKPKKVAVQQKPAGVTDAIQYAVQPVKDQFAPSKEPPTRSTYRIRDMLNNDTDIPPATLRFSSAPSVDHTPPNLTLHRTSASQVPTPARSGLIGLSAIMHQHDVQSERTTPAAQRESMPSREAYSSPAPARAWAELPSKQPSFIRPMSLEELRRKDPLNMLREMLNFKGKPDGKNVASQRPEISGTAPRERGQMTAPPLLTRPFSPSGTSERADQAKDSRRASSAYNASPSTAPLSYQQSPSAAPAYLSRQGSQDSGPSHWERDRRLSGSQAHQPPPQPFTASPQQSKTALTHQSPFSAPNAPAPPQLPSISQTLPTKSSGAQPSAPINFRFAHYDPAPPRSAYQPQPNYPPSSQAPPASHPPHYTSSYNGPSNQGGYIPPPGSFQAPPPPPTTTTNASTPYPPLKIHQYGGQPILPANMAPPSSHTQPSSMTFIGQTAPPAYSPPQHHAAPQSNPSYDASAPRQPEALSERPAEPGSGPARQPRRPYRSYHAPGSQFRPYNGPDSSRRRGG